MKRAALLLIAILFFCISNAQINLNQGLIAYYPFNGNANDASGNNINGVVNAATLTSDRYGNANTAYYFNGSAYIQLPYSPLYNFAPADSFSISVWVLPDQGYSWPAQAVVVKSPFTSDFNLSNWNYGTYVLNYKAMAGFAYNAVVNGTTTFNSSSCWYNIIQTYKNGIWRLYVNGVLESSDLSQTKLILQDGPASKICFGKKGDANGDYYKGKMDEVRIYNRVLNLNEVAALSQSPCGILSCNNWLYTSADPQTVTVGDLDVTGNQLTVEAVYNRVSGIVVPGASFGKLVSKHTGPADVNYSLMPYTAEITTTNGYVNTPPACMPLYDKTYHVAMVYDGSSLKFYQNGHLMSSVPWSGTLVNNNLPTTIGNGAGGAGPLYEHYGFINEVRIWNVARTQAQIQAYMNGSLPNPSTQTGLLGYYTFDNLLNKQGNPAYNGTLNSGATINQTNPVCTFTPDSCTLIAPISNIINDYTPVLSRNPCNNSITVEDATAFNVGDTVLLMQMKGAIIDSTNTATFGAVTDYKNAGNYEYNYVKSKTGNIILLKNQLTRSYDIPDGKVQLIRVPYYSSAVVTSTLTCPNWDGSKGGVIAFNVETSLTLNSDIIATRKGFRGGNTYNIGPAVLSCQQNGFFADSSSQQNGRKGEGIATISSAKLDSRGPLANGGGGGNGHNAGGGGGSNPVTGGLGGYQLYECINSNYDNRGLGGTGLTYSNAANKVFMGGGGGSGHKDGLPTVTNSSAGGNGGGIIMINAASLTSNGHIIAAAGFRAPQCDLDGFNCLHDGMGGGGGGGSILLNIQNFVDAHKEDVKGGKGADLTLFSAAAGHVGPGGGGSGGVVWFSNNSIPANATITNNGGANGVINLDGNNPFGATSGNTGQTLLNLNMPVDQVLFVPNIDSVRIKDSIMNCNGFDFKGLAYINTSPISNWQWDFGDSGTGNGQHTTHAYSVAGTYTVKLVITDVNGCKDSITKNVISLPGLVADAGNDTAICSNTVVTVQLHGNGGGPYTWSPAAYLNNPNLQNPTATISATTKFYLNITSISGCNAVDSVTITINPVPLVKTLDDTPVCKRSVLVLTTLPGTGTYNWSPGIYVSDSTISSPIFTDTVSRTLIVTGTNAFGCSAKDTINIFVKPLPVVKTIEDSIICNASSITLLTTGNAVSYSWAPPVFLSNPNIASPVFTGSGSQTYYVTGTGANGCKNIDTLNITVSTPKVFQAPPNKSMCESNAVMLDGNNGTVGVSYLWSPASYLSSTSIINPMANPPATKQYTVLISDAVCKNDSSFNVLVTVSPKPIINAGKSNDIDCAHLTAQLSASGGISYIWTPATGLNDNTIPNPVATITNTQQYVVQVTNATGCSNKDSVTVYSNIALSLGRYMPNAFTPNGDGLNDCYGLTRWYFVRKLQFIIYDRWGEKVFSTNNPSACWNGYYKGKKAEPGAYVYYIKAETDCGTEEQKGTLMLVR